MGLTIHYGLKSTTRSTNRAKQLVEQMRQLALDLPFETVGEVRYLGPEVCQRPLEELRGDNDLFSTVLDGSLGVAVPWNKKQGASRTVQPLEIISFWTVPGPGSEWAGIGLARYPSEIEVTYRPRDDDRFIRTIKNGRSTSWEFSWRNWTRWLKRTGHDEFLSSYDERFQENRRIKTRLSGWRYSSFCKTQYASDPRCGGAANFVKCHLSVIHLLEKIAQLPSMTVQTNDEGNYGPSFFTDDWKVPEPVYTWHPGKYDVQALVQEVGEWNEMIAAMLGAWNDLLKGNGSSGVIEAPITGYPNFEHLEFKGANSEQLRPFLQAMEKLAAQERAKHADEDAA